MTCHIYHDRHLVICKHGVNQGSALLYVYSSTTSRWTDVGIDSLARGCVKDFANLHRF